MVKEVFADTAYFIALNIQRDRLHQRALTLETSLVIPSFLAASLSSPASLLDVLAQCRHQIGPHREQSRSLATDAFLEARRVLKTRGSRNSDRAAAG